MADLSWLNPIEKDCINVRDQVNSVLKENGWISTPAGQQLHNYMEEFIVSVCDNIDRVKEGGSSD